MYSHIKISSMALVGVAAERFLVLLMGAALVTATTVLPVQPPSPSNLDPPYGDRRNITYDWAWRSGRATWFGGSDRWSIFNGSCNYQYIYPDEPLGWNVIALADVDPEYPDSCGMCYEVSCDPSWTSDAYGGSFDRTQACLDPSTSLVVRVVDVCPCQYPGNAYSNKRWCCGDRSGHMDMSVWAFERLAEPRWGVIPLRYRPVPCDYQPDQQAPALTDPTPPVAPPMGTVRASRDWPEFYPDGNSTRLSIFEDGYSDGIQDASWKTQLQSLADSAQSGAMGSQALCGKVYMGGALAFRGWKGMFQGHKAVEFWLYVGYTGLDGQEQKTPDLWVSVSGDQGGCLPRRILDSKPIYFEPTWKPYATTYFWGWQVYLPAFITGVPLDTVISKPSDFQGCGGNVVEDLDTLEFRNDGWADQWFCIDRVRLI